MAFTDWNQIKSLGKGGQGEVFLVEQPTTGPQHVDRFRVALQKVARDHYADAQIPNSQALIDLIREVVPVRRGALKKLRPPEAQINATATLERMKREVAALQGIKHPALAKILEENLAERWFVMEFCSGGALNKDLARTKGLVLRTLQRLRPIVEATAILHARNLVHRDIKPKNIFVKENGDLVLGLRARIRA